jgi:hypothetical protein
MQDHPGRAHGPSRAAVALICVVLAVIALTRTGHSVESPDVRTYLEMTRGIALHGLPHLYNGPGDVFPALQVPWNLYVHQSSWGIYGPLYPYYAAPFLLLGGLKLVSIATFALNIPIALLARALAVRLTGRGGCGAAAAAISAFSTPIAAKSLEMTAYPMMALVALAATLCTVVAVESGERRQLFSALAGLTWAAAVATHVLCFPMAAASIAALAFADVAEKKFWPTRAALVSSATAAGGMALGLVPLAALNHVRFGAYNPLSYGPTPWAGTVYGTLGDMTLLGHLQYALPVFAWTGATLVGVVMAARLPQRRALAVVLALVVAAAMLAASSVLRERTFAFARTMVAFVVDMTVMPLDAAYPRAPGGFGFLYGPWTIKSTLQCTPLFLVLGGLPFLPVDGRLRKKLLLTLLPCAALYGYLMLRSNLDLSAALGYPWVYIRYTFPALPILAAASFVAVAPLAATWRHWIVAAVAAAVIGGILMTGVDDTPLYRRVTVLVVPLIVATVALACVLLHRFERLSGGAAAAAVALACGVGMGIGLGHDLRANIEGKMYCDFRVDLMAKLAPARFAVYGKMPAMETVLALRAERDIEYADTSQLDELSKMRPLLERWFNQDRPVFLVTDGPPVSPWQDVAYETLDEHEHIYRVLPVR